MGYTVGFLSVYFWALFKTYVSKLAPATSWQILNLAKDFRPEIGWFTLEWLVTVNNVSVRSWQYLLCNMQHEEVHNQTYFREQKLNIAPEIIDWELFWVLSRWRFQSGWNGFCSGSRGIWNLAETSHLPSKHQPNVGMKKQKNRNPAGKHIWHAGSPLMQLSRIKLINSTNFG